MGDLPLRTPTHRRLGGPLPRQQANAPHAHPRTDHSFHRETMRLRGTRDIRPDFSGLSPSRGQVAYVLLTSAPVAGGVLLRPAAPRLACVKPVASVHPEPGSNSSLLYLVLFRFTGIKTRPTPNEPLPDTGRHLSLSFITCSRKSYKESNGELLP